MTADDSIPPPADDDRTDEWLNAVKALTALARRRRPDGEPSDFADTLVAALKAVAANLGAKHRVTEGRPGSWESALLDDMLDSALGEVEPEQLAAYRTEPVRIGIVPNQLLTEAFWSKETALPTPYDEAYDEIWREHDEKCTQARENHGESEDPLEAILTALEEAAEGAAEALRLRYQFAYRTWAETMKWQIIRQATLLELPVPVEVTVADGINVSWHLAGATNNPADPEWDDNADPIAWRVWSAALEIVGPPTLPELPGAGDAAPV